MSLTVRPCGITVAKMGVGTLVVRVEQSPGGLWTWWCTLDGVSTGPWPGYHDEGTARAAARCWYPLPDRSDA